ncbi:hypothetical protein CBS101457_001910 [Exobasidium rhododendri]|nr:hypothetical protein CBS101457_001910 [Exobasidium rhododendri]
MASMDGKPSFTPFPDLTGWRTSSSRRSSSEHISVTLPLEHNEEDLRQCARRLGDYEASDILIAAWAVVLIHLLSQEENVDVHFYVDDAILVHLSASHSDLHQLSVSALLHRLSEAKSEISDKALSQADNAVRLNVSDGATFTRSTNTSLLFSSSFSLDGSRILLSLQASPMVHNQSSAQMHLSQVGSCLAYLCKASTCSPAMSLDYFSDDLLAGDNPCPTLLLDDVGRGGLKEERFEHQAERIAARYPEAIALDYRASLDAPAGQEESGNVLWTYAELNRRSEIIREHVQQQLDEMGKQEGTEVVALCMEKSPFTYVSILGVLKAGAAWCPIDTDWPAARRKALLEKSGARVVLSTGEVVSEQLKEVSPSSMHIIRLDAIDYDQQSSVASLPRLSSEELAYLIWTSGTTGLPKAVGIQHKAAVQALRSLQRTIPHNGRSFRYLQFSAYNFDLMILDVFYTWGLGGTLCSSNRSMLLTNLVPLSNALQVTHTLLTPAVLAMTPREAIPTLQTVINGGEKLNEAVADTWSMNCCLLNLYGPAEATLIAMHRIVPHNDRTKAPNIGRALPTTSCHALDANDKVVLKGALGQLVLGGHQCAVGYMGETGKTEKVFVEHPVLKRIYKTGDIVRQLWNGDFEYLGRSDDQIKVNGIRIELLEINAAIKSSSKDVNDSETLVVKSGEEEDVEIVSFSTIVSDGGRVTTQDDSLIRTDESAVQVARHLAQSAAVNLPSYMVPSMFVIVDHFPRTSSAKIDRKALQREIKGLDRLEWLKRISEVAGEDEGERAASWEESTIRFHLAELCGLAPDRLSLNTPFLSLGLNSIKAITLSHRLAKSGMSVSVVDIIQYDTLLRLTQRVKSSSLEHDSRMSRSEQYFQQFDLRYRLAVSTYLHKKWLNPVSIAQVMPVTPLQEGLLSETLRDRTRYWLSRAYALPTTVDYSRLVQAIYAVVQKLDILRTSFVERAQVPHSRTQRTEEGFLQVVSKDIDADLIEIEAKGELTESFVMDLVNGNTHLNVIDGRPPVTFILVRGERPLLVVVLHHALYDQVTLSLIEDAISASYLDQVLPETHSFSTALRHLIAWDEEEHARRLEHWKQALAKYPRGHFASFPSLIDQDVTSLSDRFSSFRRESTISYQRISNVAKGMNTSIRPILQAAWAAILCVYCRTDHVLLGDSISPRSTSVAMSQVTGPVLDTLPIPIHVGNSFRQVIHELDDFHRRAISNLPVPIRHLRKMIDVPHNASLFTSVFVFEPPEEHESKRQTADLFLTTDDFGISVEHDIAVEVKVTGEGNLLLGLVGKESIISARSAHLLLAQWDAAISQAMLEPDSMATRFKADYFSDALLSVSQYALPEAIEIARNVPAFEALTRWARDTPHALCIEFYPSLQRGSALQTKTYAELECESERVASHLVASLAPGSVIAISLRRRIEAYCLLLGVWKAGMVYLPIDPSLPAKRKNLILQDSGAKCVVWSSSTQWDLESDERTLINVDSSSFHSTCKASSKSAHLPKLDASSDAYILYTSGTTGTPKGCLLTHGNLSSTIEAFRSTIDKEAPNTLNQKTRFLARSVESFDVALIETLLPLRVGGTIVTGPREVILEDIGVAMKAMQVTHAAVVPSLFYTNEGGSRRRILPADVPHLLALIVGGERIARDIITLWAPSGIPLLNAYGPTESCIGNSIAKMGLNDLTSRIGRPFPTSRFVVLGESIEGWEPLLRGCVGELFIGGPQVGSYLHQPDSSAFIYWKGQRYYRTGDEVRMRPDDVTDYVGRISKSQVKLRGVRIELDEIDSTLGKKAKLNSFITTMMMSKPTAYLVTFVAPQTSSLLHKEEEQLELATQPSLQEEAKELMTFAKSQLPSAMVPRMILPLKRLPLSAISGKLDTRRLDEWFHTISSEILSSHSSATKEEDDRRLTERESIVKEEILRLFPDGTSVSSIGPSTDIFSLGLDSLNIIALSSALARRSINVDIGFIMSNASVEVIARGIPGVSERSSEAWLDRTEDARRESTEDIIVAAPLLPLQESMVIQTLSEQGSSLPPRYINVIAFTFKDKIDKQRLHSSVTAALKSQEIYRTIFIETQTSVLQAVKRTEANWRVEESNHFKERAVQDIMRSMACNAPLRYCITDSGQFLLALHHAIYDGDSLASLLADIERRYHNSDDEAVDKDQKEYQFVDYVREVGKVSMESKLDVWQKRLEDSIVTPFPCLTGRKVDGEAPRERVTAECRTRASLTQLRSLAKGERVTLQMLVLDTFARLYSQYVSEDEVLFGIVLGGRLGELAHVHGPCINTVPFSYRVSTDDWRGQLQETYGEALRNQHVSLPALSRRLRVQDHLFNTLFSYLGVEKTNEMFEETSSELAIEYPFAVEVQEMVQSDAMEVRLVYDSRYLSPIQASLFLQQLDMLLCAKIPSNDQLDRRMLAIENEHPYTPQSSDAFLHRFQIHVKRQPSALAFVFSHDYTLSDEKYTFARLDEASDRMARELMKRSGDVIGVLLQRGPTLYVLLLSIWKAAKVYLPLDPSLPLERLEYMVSVAKPALIISAGDSIRIAQQLGDCVCVDELVKNESDEAGSDQRLPRPSLEATAYIIFTSGSSGKPKGVQVSHTALAAALYSWDSLLPHSDRSRILQLASPGFDVFLFEVCLPLASGFSFASASKEDLLNDLEFTFTRLELTMADLPAVLATTIRPENITTNRRLEWLMSGGDEIDDQVIQRWSSYGLINAWGPTETTIGNTLGFVTKESSRNWIGKPYPTSSLYILRFHSTDIVFRGCVGEIAVGGSQVADGYVGNEVMTAEMFVTLSSGARVYKTGDRGRLLSDGSLEYLGRMDDGQVKINSQRVELKEIEVELKKHKTVVDVLVRYAKHPEMQSKQLVAFFVVVEGGNDEGQGEYFRWDAKAKEGVDLCLREASKHLAGYMIPAHCFVLNAKRLPLTPNNKVDTKKLELMFANLSAQSIRQQFQGRSDQQDPPSSTGVMESWSDVEERLRDVIASFCGLQAGQVEKRISFYHLGIDSISGYRLLKKMRESGFESLVLRDLLKAQTIASLALVLEGKGDKGSTQSLHRESSHEMDRKLRESCDPSAWQLSPEDEIKMILPCTPLQEGLLLQTLASDGELYVHHHLFSMRKADSKSVVDAISQMVKTYDILRTSFHLVEGQFVQAVHSDAGLTVPPTIVTSDLQATISSVLSIKSFCDEESLAAPPLMIKFIQSEGETVLDIILHHALYDGESLEMLFDEIEERVKKRHSEEKSRLQFEDLLPSLLSTPRDEEYIVNQIGDCPSTLLGRYPSKPSSRPCHMIKQALNVDVKSLLTFASSLGVSVQVVALFSFSKLLAHLTKRNNVLFAQLFSLRDSLIGAESVIGPALNSVLTKVTFTCDETTSDTLRRLQRDHDAGREHRCASMVKVMRLLKKERGGEAVEFDSLFDFQNVREDDKHTEEAATEKVMVPWDDREDADDNNHTQYALNIQFKMEGRNMSAIAVGDSTCFSLVDLREMMMLLEGILALTVAQSSLPTTVMPDGVSDISGLGVEDSSKTPSYMSSLSTPRFDVHLSSRSDRPRRELTAIEEMVSVIIAEMIDSEGETLEVTAPVSQFGLDSITAIKMASLLRKKGIAVGVVDILQGRTIEGISRRLQERKDNISTKEKQKDGNIDSFNLKETEEIAKEMMIEVDQIEAVLPLLPGQEFELAEYLQSRGQGGIFSFIYRIKLESFSEERLAQAWHELCNCHSILRSCFRLHNGRPLQIMLRHVNELDSWQTRRIDVPMEEWLEGGEYRNVEWVEEACKIKEDLALPPRAACLVRALDGYVFVLRLHHILYDAWSIAIMMQDLDRLYRDSNARICTGNHIDYVKHAIQEKDTLHEESKEYWKRLLLDVPPCIVPDREARSGESQRRRKKTAFVSFANVLEHASALDSYFKTTENTSLATVFIAAWSKVLLRLFDSHGRVQFGLYHRARSTDYQDVERVASNCMNVLPLVVKRDSGAITAAMSLEIKAQLEDQCRFETSTSIVDILAWFNRDAAQWNTYLNLLWDGESYDSKADQEVAVFESVNPLALFSDDLDVPREESTFNDDHWKSARLCNMRIDINVDVHWDRQKDCINVAFRYQEGIWSANDVLNILDELKGYVVSL